MHRGWQYFWQHLSVAAICISLVSAPACTTAQKLAVVGDVQRFIPAITNVADSVCAFTGTAPICVAGVSSVTASANVLITALQNYYQAEANGVAPPSVVQALQTAVTTFEADAAAILDAVHVLDPAHQALVEGLAASAGVLLAVIETLIPGTVTAAKFKANAPTRAFDLNSWVKDYNARAESLQKQLPRAVTLKKVHYHGLAVRMLSFGGLQ